MIREEMQEVRSCLSFVECRGHNSKLQQCRQALRLWGVGKEVLSCFVSRPQGRTGKGPAIPRPVRAGVGGSHRAASS